jgi:uncharacterized RDD family membrane protein YckC
LIKFAKRHILKTIEFESAQHVRIEYDLASTMQRVAAASIDFLIFLVYFVLFTLSFNLSSVFTDYGSQLFVNLLLIKLPWIFYNPIVEYLTKGQTLGKYAMGIRVVTLEGERPGLKEVLTRWLFKADFLWISADFLLIFWFALGFLGTVFTGLTQFRQRLGDMMANTVVIRDRPLRQLQLKDLLALPKNFNITPTYPEVTRFTDEDMLLIKNTLQRLKKHPNSETKMFVVKLADEIARLIDLKETPAKRSEFLQTLLQDYVTLTR